MNWKRTFYLTAFLGIMMTTAAGQTSPEYKILFEKAKFTMETKGDINGAISLFNDIINKYPKEREYSARSQYYIGLCYEKLGVEEAKKAYEKVVSLYADQSVIAAQARARLDALGGSSGMAEKLKPKDKDEIRARLSMKRLDYPQLMTTEAHISPDGEKVAYKATGASAVSINILDLKSGIDKVFVNGLPEGDITFAWSPQGNKIAYSFKGGDLWVCNIDGSDKRVLLKRTDGQIDVCNWSAYGDKILFGKEPDDSTTQIYTITPEGNVQYLFSAKRYEFISEPKISPDGVYITCALGDVLGNTDIYVWNSDGSKKVQITSSPSRNENPVWSPDGKYILFLSDRNRSIDLWGVQMQDGKSAGTPFVIKQDISWRVQIIDLTDDGKLFMFMYGGREPGNLYKIPVDQAGGTLNGPITPMSVYPTDHMFPRYSPDGQMIAYHSRRGEMGWPKLFVMNKNNAEKELSLQGHYVINLAWSPDSKSIYFAGWNKAFRTGIYQLSLETNGLRPVFTDSVYMKNRSRALINISLLPYAGEFMFFRLLPENKVDILKCKPDGSKFSVVLRNVKMPVWGLPSPTGENICYRLGDSLMTISVPDGNEKLIGTSTLNLEATWSPHGENLMYREGNRLRLYSLKENTGRTLYEAPSGKKIGGMEMYSPSWSPDGRNFIFTESDTSEIPASPQKLMLIRPENGSVKIIGEVPGGYFLSDLRWAPDGRMVVATGNTISRQINPLYSYWVLENFLPK